MSQGGLVKVYQSQGIFAAEVVKAKLEANGIPAMLKYESVGQVIGITVDGLGRVEVLVSAENAAEAAELVEERDDDALSDVDDTAENDEESN
jgi:hypothetical protein